jgi:hypothetical protein
MAPHFSCVAKRAVVSDTRPRSFDFFTDFHNSFESHPSRKPFPSANLYPFVANRDAPSSNNIVSVNGVYHGRVGALSTASAQNPILPFARSLTPLLSILLPTPTL